MNSEDYSYVENYLIGSIPEINKCKQSYLDQTTKIFNEAVKNLKIENLFYISRGRKQKQPMIVMRDGLSSILHSKKLKEEWKKSDSTYYRHIPLIAKAWLNLWNSNRKQTYQYDTSEWIYEYNKKKKYFIQLSKNATEEDTFENNPDEDTSEDNDDEEKGKHFDEEDTFKNNADEDTYKNNADEDTFKNNADEDIFKNNADEDIFKNNADEDTFKNNADEDASHTSRSKRSRSKAYPSVASDVSPSSFQSFYEESSKQQVLVLESKIKNMKNCIQNCQDELPSKLKKTLMEMIESMELSNIKTISLHLYQ